MEDKYRNFFEFIEKFKGKQRKQKQNGTNDYNMVNVVRKETEEVGMHSNVIYSLLDPNGLHYQEDLFLKIFINDVLEIDSFGDILGVEAEESTNEKRRIDFTIKSSIYYIGIEMKIDAYDLENQISHYYEDLNLKASKDLNQEVIIYYLTKNGKDASIHSSNNIDYKKISFEKHILKWLENCQNEIKNITNLYEAFENYKDIVKKITNKYQGKIMTLKDELLKNKEYMQTAKEISKAYEEAIEEQKNIKLNIVVDILNQNDVSFDVKVPKWFGVDIYSNFIIRIISENEHYLVQVFDKESFLEDVDKSKKNDVLDKLCKIDGRFKSGYSKVYGQMVINYNEINNEQLSELLLKLIKIDI